MPSTSKEPGPNRLIKGQHPPNLSICLREIRWTFPLMHHFDQVRYSENSDFQAVELPYSTGDLAMVILLPRQLDGCSRLEDGLTSSMLTGWIGKMKKQRIEIFLPRFKLESEFDLVKTLAIMGMPDAFGLKSDFSGIDGGK